MDVFIIVAFRLLLWAAGTIVTMRLHTQTTVEQIAPLMAWDELVPLNKCAALNHYQGDKKGHPPRGD